VTCNSNKCPAFKTDTLTGRRWRKPTSSQWHRRGRGRSETQNTKNIADCGRRRCRAAYSNACRLERRPGVRERIEYLSHQAEELIAEKRRRIEETLWAIHEADIGEFFETVEVAKNDRDSKAETDEAGKMLMLKKQRPKLLSDLPPDLRKAIEHIQVDARGNVVPQLYSKLQANAELRKMLNIGGQKERPGTDVSRLTDAELISQLAEQAKQLGIHIDLNYSFLKRDE
jgi:Terminase small subunit